METIHLLTADNEQGLDAFEDQYHFTSLTSVVDDALETLYEIEDPNVYASALEAYDDLLTVTESGLVVPRVIARGYSHIANPDGVFYVKDIKYTVTSEKVFYESTNPQTRSSIQGEFDYISDTYNPNEGDPETRMERIESKYFDLWHQIGSRRLSLLVHVIDYSFYDEGLSSHSYDVQFTMYYTNLNFGSPSFPFESRFTIDQLHFKLQHNVPLPFVAVGTITESASIVSPFGRIFHLTYPNVLNANYPGIPTPAHFTELRLRVTNTATGNCGILINSHPYEIPSLPPCR